MLTVLGMLVWLLCWALRALYFAIITSPPPTPMALEILCKPASRDAIACVGNDCLVNRATLERSMRATSHQLSHAQERIVQTPRGLKLLGVRSGSLLASAGLRSGDVIHAINHLPVTSPEQALSIHAALRTARFVIVDLDRDGDLVRMTYQIIGND